MRELALRRGVEVLERAERPAQPAQTRPCAAPRSTTACRCSRCGASSTGGRAQAPSDRTHRL